MPTRKSIIKDGKKAKSKKKGFTEATRLVVNPFDRSLWIAGERTLLHLDSEGALLEVVESPGHIDAITLGLDESLWVLGRRQLWQVAPDGSLTEPLNLPELIEQLKDDHADVHGHARGHGDSKRTRFMALDSVRQVLWLANQRHLARINLKDSNDAAIVYHAEASAKSKRRKKHHIRRKHRHKHDTAALIRDLTLSPVDGTLWLANRDELLAFDRSGDPVATLGLPEDLKKPETLAFDPRSQSLWLANKHAVGHFAISGALITTVPADKTVQALGVEPFHLLPSLDLIEPVDGVQTNNSRPTIAYAIGATCNGAVCNPGNDYFEDFTLDVDLNNQRIDSSLFNITGKEATHIPSTPLAEGINTLAAQAEDGFGHHSDTVTSGFTIDTHAPQFVDLTPADGSALNTAVIAIQGRVDEMATVILTHPDGQTSVGGTPFAFAVTLTEGSNTFGLTARDAAGNQTTVSLAITLDTVPPTVPDIRLIAISGPDADDKVTVTGGNGSVEANATVIISNTRTGERVTVTANENGAFTAQLAGQVGDTYQIVVSDQAQNNSDPVEISTSVVIPPDSEPAFILYANPSNGVAPLTVVFSLLGEAVPTTLTLDLEGDGIKDFTSPSLDGQIFSYASAGRFLPTVTVTDAQGNQFTASVEVLVEDQAALDALLQSQWAGMTAALQQGDIQGALQFIAPQGRAAYEAMFTELAPILSTVGADLGDIQFVEVRGNLAEYELLAVEDGQSVSYYVEFNQDEDEQWHLKFF